jgi:hypothetical protein
MPLFVVGDAIGDPERKADPRAVFPGTSIGTKALLIFAAAGCGQNLNEPRDRSVLRSGVAVQIDLDLINIAPTPTFRRIVALNDRMSGGVKMLRRVLPGGLIAAANVPALPTDPQMHPWASSLKALLAASCTGLDLHDAAEMGAFGAHAGFILS